MGGKMLLCSLWKKSSLLFTYKNYSGSKFYSRIVLITHTLLYILLCLFCDTTFMCHKLTGPQKSSLSSLCFKRLISCEEYLYHKQPIRLSGQTLKALWRSRKLQGANPIPQSRFKENPQCLAQGFTRVAGRPEPQKRSPSLPPRLALQPPWRPQGSNR